mgnify:CR=1 FL=1
MTVAKTLRWTLVYIELFVNLLKWRPLRDCRKVLQCLVFGDVSTYNNKDNYQFHYPKLTRNQIELNANARKRRRVSVAKTLRPGPRLAPTIQKLFFDGIGFDHTAITDSVKPNPIWPFTWASHSGVG